MAFIRRPIDQPKVEKDVFLALDIGTEFIKAVLARRGDDESLEIIGIGRAPQASGNMHASAIADIEGVIASCEKALAAAERTAGVTAHSTIVGIAGELVKSSTSSVHYRREDSRKPISEQEMSTIMTRVQKRAEASAKQEISLETGSSDTEICLVNSAIVSLSIDGCKVNNPIGFKGTELVIQYYTAFAPLIHVSAIEKVCAELNLDLLAVAVEPFAVCRACLGDRVDGDFSGIIVDIGGDTTNLAIVSHGNIEGTRMFGIGGHSFKKQLETEGEVDYSIWLAGVTIAIEDFELEHLPDVVYLCGGTANSTELEETLALTNWYKELPFSRRPVIQLIDTSELPGVKNATTDALDVSFATALGLLRVGLDTATSAPSEHSLKSKISKLLQN